MYDLIVFLPLLGFLIAGLFGRQIGDARLRAGHHRPARRLRAAVLDRLLHRSALGHDEQALIVPVANWLTSGKLAVDWALRIDMLTAVMLVVVTTVSFVVHLYSIGYMAEDPSRPRFFAYPVAVHLRHADAGDGRQSRADVLRLGRRRPRLLSADRLLVRAAVGQRRGDQGLRRQPRRRLRLRARHLPAVRADRLGRASSTIFAAAPGMAGKTIHLFGHRLATR